MGPETMSESMKAHLMGALKVEMKALQLVMFWMDYLMALKWENLTEIMLV